MRAGFNWRPYVLRAYKECEPFLCTIYAPVEQSDIVKEAKIEALKSLAKRLLGIDLLEVKIARERQLDRKLNIDETIELFENELTRLRGKYNPRRIVHERARKIPELWVADHHDTAIKKNTNE